MDLPQIDNYQSLFLNDTDLLDVRAPIEFTQGAFPCSTNYPLMSDEDRHLIGLRYKERGQDEAIKLGYERVSGEVKQTRTNHWKHFVDQHPLGALYCFRGGLRSRITQQWIYETTGIVYPRIKGGYKALRRYLLFELEKSINTIQFTLLSGRTGSGKTLLLHELSNMIDLERIYHHRGSAFGNHVTPQPSQIDIENTLSIALLKQRHAQNNKLVLEDEGANIGSRRLPEHLIQVMKKAPLVILETSLDERVENIFNEYIVLSLQEYQDNLGSEIGFTQWSNNLSIAFVKIKRRLGGLRYSELKSLFDNAIDSHKNQNNPNQHKHWIRSLLEDYYDPMYDYQLSKKTDRLIFRGNKSEVMASFVKQ